MALERGNCGVTANGYRVSLRGAENVLKSFVMAAQKLGTCTLEMGELCSMWSTSQCNCSIKDRQ